MDKHELFTIGQMSKVSGLSPDTLRYYDKVGLICPQIVDKETGYRYYSVKQVWLTDMITMFRRLDMSIEEIRAVTEARNNDEVTEMLVRRRDEAKRLSLYYANVADDIEWYEEQNELLNNTEPSNEVTVKHYDKVRVIFGSSSGELEDYHKTLDETMVKFRNTYGTMRRHYSYLLDENDVAQGIFRKTAEYVVFERYQPTEKDGADLMDIPGGEYACFTAEAADGRIDFSPLTGWLKDNGRETDLYIADDIGLQLLQVEKYRMIYNIRAHLKK
ncbi:MAG: helix-turn-helix domain-containing protein [Eubacteriaceae bacterium]|jgi:DNA-binding transcriptional MerR regulator|nr:helix-turn-helix domain-containing protein [Eubacteriaceae bacterium]